MEPDSLALLTVEEELCGLLQPLGNDPMKVRIFRSAPLWLALLAATLIVLWSAQAFSGVQGHQWLLGVVAPLIVLFAIFLVAYTHERASGWSWSKRSRSFRLRSGLFVSGYLLAVMVSGTTLRHSFSPQVEATYTTLYWAFSSAILIISLGFYTLPITHIRHKNGIKWTLLALLILMGVASGPIIWGWGPGPTVNTPTTVIALVIWVAPMLLYYMKTLPFDSPRASEPS